MPAEANDRVAKPARRTAVPLHGKVPAMVRARPCGLTQPEPIPGPLRNPARPTQPLEPILFPKLRIQFADFPYLHYSIDQRLLTLETCCGYGYELVRVRRNLPRIFKVPPGTRGCRENCGTLRLEPKPILPARGFQGLGGLCRKDNSSQSSGGRLLVVSRCHDGYEGPNGSATRFWNMDQIPFRLLIGFNREINRQTIV